MTAPEPDASTPPAPRPATPQQRDGGSLPSPAGSKGYRALGDPPPRGHPLTSPPPRGASRGSPPAPTPQPQRSSGQATPGVVDSPKVPPASPVQPAIAQPVEPPDEPPTAGPESGDDVPGQPPADHRRLILLLAVVASLLVHGALAWWSRNQPLGHIDPTLIRQERQLFRVQRAQRDMILDGGAGLAPGGVSSAAAQPDNPRSPLTDLGLSMLNAEPSPRPQPMGAGQNGAPDIAPQAKPFSDHRPHETGPSPAAGAPATQLPASIRDQMFVDIPLATQYVGQGGQGSAATGQGSGDGVAPTGGEGSGQGQASSMLAQAGRSGATPANPKLPDLAAPALVDKPDLSDKRPADQALTPQPIDLSAITAQAATQLAIPEHLDNDFDYAVTRYIPKGGWGVSREEERGYFRVDITGKRSLRRLQTMPKDMVYLIDISGSVSQDWVDHTLRGVRDSLASLNPGDRFNIVYFADKPAILSSQGILPANDENFEKARQFLASAQSGGMTDVNQALSRLLVRDVASNRAYNLVLISDGRPTRGVMDTRELINLITRDNDLATSIYCVGIGKIQNRTLLEFLAYRNKGFCVYVEEPLQTPAAVRDLTSRLRYPIIKDIRLSVMGLDGSEVFPVDLPNIHQGETFSIFGRFDVPVPEGKPFTMRLVGHNGQQAYDFTFTRDLSAAPIGEQQISRDWAFWKLHHLYSVMLRQGDTRELRQAIEYLRRRYKLETLYR